VLDVHGTVLDVHGTVLDVHGTVLDVHGAVSAEHGREPSLLPIGVDELAAWVRMISRQ
jgi:hypothetical protein